MLVEPSRSPKTFKIKAGIKAKSHIEKYGLDPTDISVIPAAAGGPKWISLYGFDKYLLNKWFKNRSETLHLVGASAGAWRMLCYALPNPTDALDRFLKHYVEQRYQEIPPPEFLTGKMHELLKGTLGSYTAADLFNNKNRQLNIISSLSKKNNIHFPKAYFLSLVSQNLISRNWLSKSLQRVVFTNHQQTEFIKPDGFTTHYIPFNQENIISALRSTGAIPLMMEPVDDISECDGLLWDGALIDYHIGLDYNTEGLIFYPHFSSHITKGWFDKFLRWRKFKGPVLDKMIMIYPSNDFVQSWPDSKIPDRKDFETYFNDNDLRIKNWYKVAKLGEEMAEEFDWFWKAGRLVDIVEGF